MYVVACGYSSPSRSQVMTPLGVDARQHGDCALGVVHELSPEGIHTLRRRDIYFVTCKPTARILRAISVLGCALPADRRQEHLADGTPIGPIEPKRRGGIGGGKHDARARVVHRRRLLSKRPDARFATAAEVLTALHDGARPIEVAQLALSSSQSPSAPPVRPASLPSLLSVVNSVIADPSVALRIMTPARWAAAAVVAMILFMMSLWVLGSWARSRVANFRVRHRWPQARLPIRLRLRLTQRRHFRLYPRRLHPPQKDAPRRRPHPQLRPAKSRTGIARGQAVSTFPHLASGSTK